MWQVYVATRPTCGPRLMLSPAVKCWEPPRRQGLCSHLAHLWPCWWPLGALWCALGASSVPPEIVQGLTAWLHRARSMRCFQNFCEQGPPLSRLLEQGPLLILSPALKGWGPPRPQGLRCHLAHLWATADFVPRCEALGTPWAAGVMQPPGPTKDKPHFGTTDPPSRVGQFFIWSEATGFQGRAVLPGRMSWAAVAGRRMAGSQTNVWWRGRCCCGPKTHPCPSKHLSKHVFLSPPPSK